MRGRRRCCTWCGEPYKHAQALVSMLTSWGYRAGDRLCWRCAVVLQSAIERLRAEMQP